MIDGASRAFPFTRAARTTRADAGPGFLLPLRAIWGACCLALRRLASTPWLALATLLGLTSAAVLAMSIPMYADAAYGRRLRDELAAAAGGRPPFSFLFHHIGSVGGPLAWEDAQQADRYLSRQALAEVGLPPQFQVRCFMSGRLGLYPRGQTDYADLLSRLAVIRFGCLSDLERHITIVEGAVAGAPAAGELPVLVSESLALQKAIEVGETFTAFAAQDSGNARILVRIAGVWRATDPNEPYWFRAPSSFQEALLIGEEYMRDLVVPQLGGRLDEAVWYVVADGSRVQAADAAPLSARIMHMQATVSAMLATAEFSSPLEALRAYRAADRALTAQLYLFSLPVMALNLAYVALVTGMAVGRRRGEIATLRSRGTSVVQCVAVAAVEGAALACLAVALAAPISMAVARCALRAQGYLSLDSRSVSATALTPSTLCCGLMAVGLALVAQVIPTIGAARHTIVSYKVEQARSLRAPLWQRTGLDLLCAIPAVYETYLLKRQGSLWVPFGRPRGSDPFGDPLLLLVPSLTAVALTLLLLRLLPGLMAFVAHLASRTRSVSLLLAARSLSRRPTAFTAPMLLLIVTCALSTFLASTAETLDSYLYEQVCYQQGADLVLRPELDSGQLGEKPGVMLPDAREGLRVPEWYYVPSEAYARVPGVAHMARVAGYRASLQGVDGLPRGTLMAVDSFAFPRVAFWRDDYASESLAGLMQRLAVTPGGVLLPWSTMQAQGLAVGDPIHVTLDLYGQKVELLLRVAGSLSCFPTWDPGGGPLYVVDLDGLAEQLTVELPTAFWFRLEPGADPEHVAALLEEQNPFCSIERPFYESIARERRRPERQGLLGMLSVGLASTALLGAVGFLLSVVFSMEHRRVELGVLRSMGLSLAQMARYLAWRLAFLVLVGLAAGIALGRLVSRLWIPHYRIPTGLFAPTLPMHVARPGGPMVGMSVLFLLLLLAACILSILAMRRLQFHELVKMGEAV